MNGLFQAALEVQGFMQRQQWRFCIIGGLAVLRWGEPRLTQDVDLSVFAGFGSEEPFIAALLEAFPARIPDAARFALHNRVLLLKTSLGVAADISLAGLPFEERVMERASDFAFTPDCVLHTCSAEDLIVYKAFAARPKDWLDVEGVVARQRVGLDPESILRELEPLALAKEAPEVMARVRKLLHA